MKRIAFIITTFIRDKLLYKSLQSLVDNWLDNFEIVIIDQGTKPTDELKVLPIIGEHIHYFQVPFNSGLSYCRNYGVEIAKDLKCDYVFIGSDSFLFNESIKKLNKLVINDLFEYDIIGVQLIPSTCGWEAKLNLIEGQSFELDFIDLYANPDKWIDEFKFRNCDIMRNCFIARTSKLLECQWDKNLKLGEHEDFFWRQKLHNIKCAWTQNIILNKQIDRPDDYAKFRKINFDEGRRLLREKYQISGWVTYKNLQRAKDYYQKKEG